MNSDNSLRKINAILVVALVFAFLQYLYLQNRHSFMSARIGSLQKQVVATEVFNRRWLQSEAQNRRLQQENDRLKQELKVLRETMSLKSQRLPLGGVDSGTIPEEAKRVLAKAQALMGGE
jgi:cell division protein FtsB